MKLTLSNVEFEFQDIQVTPKGATRSVNYWEKRGWELVRRYEANDRVTLRFKKYTPPSIKVQP